MADSVPQSPCLESTSGELIAIVGNCSFGRSRENTIRIGSDRASRRHATIHAQDAGEFWLIDLGSVNGTMLNGRRVSLPTRLQGGDRICIASEEFVFHPGEHQDYDQDLCAATVATAPDIRNEPCWLLLVDVVQYTQLSHQMNPEMLAMIVGRWIRSCKAAVEEQGGTVNKYLGDGYLAFWRGTGEMAQKIAAVSLALKKLQEDSEPAFRVVVHQGKVTIGGAATLGEECLMGPEVNYIFRMEKAAGAMGSTFCISAQARSFLAPLAPISQLPGEHELKGFPGKHILYSVD